MQYKDKRNGEIVDIEKIDPKFHNTTNEDHPYKVTHTDGSSSQHGANYYITEARLKAQFEPLNVQKKEVKEMNNNSDNIQAEET